MFESATANQDIVTALSSAVNEHSTVAFVPFLTSFSGTVISEVVFSELLVDTCINVVFQTAM